MADGRTSLIKAMEGNDMPMVDTLLGADKNQNFTDKNGFMYEMVELYQREDRGTGQWSICNSRNKLPF